MTNDPDILISRVVDGVAGEGDWQCLEEHAQKSPLVWREVALAQRQHFLLQQQVGAAAALAERVEAQPNQVAPIAYSDVDPSGIRTRFARVATWGGWAAAAAVALAFVSQSPTQKTSLSRPTQTAGLVPTIEQLQGMLSSDDARNVYVGAGQREGTVMEEVPTKLLINWAPSPDGEGGEVTFLRQFIERTKVKDLYQFTQDETGRTTVVPVPNTPRIKPAM